MTDNEAKVLEYLREAIHPDIELSTALIREGLLDSFAAVELVGYLEGELNIRFAPDEFTPEHFATPAAIAALIGSAAARGSK